MKVSYHPAKFIDHQHCGSGDTMVLVCNMILQDNLTEKSSNYGSESLKLSQDRAKFAERRHCDSEDIMVLLCQVISQDYVIKVSCHFMGRSPSR